LERPKPMSLLLFRLAEAFRFLHWLTLLHVKANRFSLPSCTSVFFCVLLTSLGLAADIGTLPTCQIELNAPGNVFFVNQTIRAEIHFPHPDAMPPQIISILTDPYNRIVRRKALHVQPPHPLFIVDEIGFLPPGYYTYIVAQSESTELENLAFTKLAVIRQPPALQPDRNPYGIDAFLSWRLKKAEDVRLAASLIRKTGVGWVRDRFSWAQMNPAPNTIDLKHYLTFDRLQRDAGLRILQVFHDCPLWASSASTGDEEARMHSAPENTMHALNFFRKVANEFSEACTYWEIWNEMDIPVFFLGTAEEYAAILKASYLGIKKGNPQAKVLLGSVTFGSGEITWGEKTYYDDEADRFVEKILENGAAEYFDIYNMHHYGAVDELPGRIRRNKRIMQRFSCRKPIWITEMGFTSTERMSADVQPSERSQAETLVKSYCVAFSEGVEKFFYFCFPSFIEHGTSFWGIFQEKDSTWEPKPAYVALATMIQALEDSPCIGRLTTVPDSVSAFVFDHKDTYTILLWGEQETTQRVCLQFAHPTTCTLRSLYGKDQTTASTSSLTLPLSSSPVYLLGIARESIARESIEPPELAKPSTSVPEPSSLLREVWTEVRTSSSRLLYRQEVCSGTAMIYNSLPQRVEGTLTIVRKAALDEPLLAQPIAVPPEARQAVPFEIRIAWDQLRGIDDLDLVPEMAISASFTEAISQKRTLPSVRYLRYVPPVKIHKIPLLSWKHWPKEAEIIVETLAVSEGRGTVRIVRSRDAGTTEILRIPYNLGLQGEAQRIRFPLPRDPRELLGRGNNSVDVEVKVDGLLVREKMYLECDAILKRNAPLTIDGKKSDWPPQTPSFHIEGRENVVIGKEAMDRPDDVAACASALWDPKNLYLFLTIHDESIMNPYRNTHPWTGDAAELFLDVRPDTSLGQPHYDKNVMQIFFIPPDDTHPEPLARIQQPAGLDASAIKIGSHKNTEGYTIEAQIPWSLATGTPVSSGRIIGMELTLDDLDHGDYQHRQLVWRGGAQNWRNPAFFQRLALLP
jgi:hypothetical protein